jgi:di/tricarboxylate transporter
MSLQSLLLIGIILGVAVLLISNKVREDVVALLSLVVLGLTNLVDNEAMFSGFSRSAVITILALFIITAGLEKTGATRILGRHLSRLAGTSETRAIVVVMLATALLSLVMNNLVAAAVLLPAVIGITRQTDLKPSKLLIPLSFGSLLGGMATLFTTANILVSTALVDQGFQPYGVLDFIPVGLPMAVSGILFMALIGRKLLPAHSLGGDRRARPGTSLAETYGLVEAVSGAYVKLGSEMAGKSVAEGEWGRLLGLSVVGIARGGQVMLAPSSGTQVLEGDVVISTGTIKDETLAQHGLIRTEDPAWQGRFISSHVSLVELVLAPRSPFAGKTLREIGFREKFDMRALALWRAGNTIQSSLADIPLEFGDALLVQTTHDRVRKLRDEPGFIILEEDRDEEPPGRKAWIAVALTTAAVILPAANLLPIAESAFAIALFMVLLGCLSMDEAYHAIEWRAIFLIAGMLPLGLAMTSTGTAVLVGDLLVDILGSWGPLALAGGIFLTTTLLTQIIGGQATAVVFAPIAIAAASVLHTDPRGIGMAVAMGCSTAFLTPFGHPSNVLVMGPGGYTLKDYTRVGLPLSLVLFITLLFALAVFWGF